MRLFKLSILSLLLVLAGCSTTAVPVVPKFPTAPDMLLKSCPTLKTIEGEKVSIIDFTKTVSENYTTYYECSVLHEGFIEWYNAQKRIFEELR
jgi:hypothetical protein